MNSNNQCLTVSQVAKLYSISNQTIYRHIKAGKLSKDSNGKISLSECLRVYGEPEITNSNNVSHSDSHIVTQQDNELVTLLKQQIDFLQSQLELAHEREKRLTALLEHQAGIVGSKPAGGFFSGFFKK